MLGDYKAEFPKQYHSMPVEILEALEVGVLEDASWHNDGCPNFVHNFDEDGERCVRMWADAERPEDREIEDSMRFTVYRTDGDDSHDSRSFDDAAEAVAYFKKLVEENR